jgi:hypothetical protein
MSEEKQGQHIVEASVAAGVECFLWSTLPSSREISGGKFVTRLYEGKTLTPWKSEYEPTNSRQTIRRRRYPGSRSQGVFYSDWKLL